MKQHLAQNLLREIMGKNRTITNLIGKGFHGTITPAPLRRYILENPRWYTPYSPYQAEISQGRLESLFNFQKMISNLTALPVSNSSLLDIGSSAGEVVSISNGFHKGKRKEFYASERMHPYILDILQSKCHALDVELYITDASNFLVNENVIGHMHQYPDTYGDIKWYEELFNEAKTNNIVQSCATDLFAITKFKPPGEIGMDISFGSAQRFGVPLYYGGPHAAFIASQPEFLRLIPGRIVGETEDACRDKCFRLALQSREQHIRKEKATSNICTSQALLANMASMYAVYHGTEGIKSIGDEIFAHTHALNKGLHLMGFMIYNENFYDTLTIVDKRSKQIYDSLREEGYLTFFDEKESHLLTISLDEIITNKDIENICKILAPFSKKPPLIERIIDSSMYRQTPILTEPIFDEINADETKFMRYVNGLCKKDYSLVEGMVPLGSCTMKLNAAYQLEPLSWDTVANCHPFAPKEYVEGYTELIEKFGNDLKNITGFDHVSFQSNSGAMGEYSALLCIKKYHNYGKNKILIPESAHGTNFASASLAGMKVIKFSDSLFDNMDKFDAYVEHHKDDLAGMMITYPSTFGVFQHNINHINDIIHRYGGIVYMDGANMNALAGITKPSEIGADVCHLNLHKTFCIPHGGGGPGMGPICCNDKLAPFLPTHRWQEPKEIERPDSIGTITASQWSSASLLTIPYLYFRELGIYGIQLSTRKAIWNANYLKKHLEKYYKVSKGEVAHEFLIDVSEFKQINEVDISKRLIDYNFHPPTMSWPKKSTLMIEPTESESIEELNRFVNALISIRREIDECPELLKNAPHPIKLIAQPWNFPYTMERAFFPQKELKNEKHWPATSRVNDLYGDKLIYDSFRSVRTQ